jgi:REP-associated tyrosine transposase
MVSTAVLARRRRNSNRHPGYDYSRPGAYFVTTCAFRRELLFENPRYLEAVRGIWFKLPRYYSNVGLDAFVVMPNHVHGIVWKEISDKRLLVPS